VSGGTNAAFTLSLSPTPATIPNGMKVYGRMAVAPVANATLSVSSGNFAAIKRRGNVVLTGNEWNAGDIVGFIMNNGAWQIDGLTINDVAGTTAGTAPTAGEGIGVSGYQVSMNVPALTTENTINPADLCMFYAEETEGGQPSGHHYKTTAADFAAAMASLGSVVSFGSSGYVKFGNGFVVQWAPVTVQPLGTTWTFPVAFPNACVAIVGTIGGAAAFMPNDVLYVQISSNSQASLDFPATDAATLYVIAIGY
jgi:hypothetical protein